MTIRKYGWRPDNYDGRDHVLVTAMSEEELPRKVDLRPVGPQEVYSQGELGSCTGQGLAYAHHFNQLKQGAAKPFTPSRLFIYFNEREMEGTVDEDAGAMIRDGVKSLAQQGVCPEDIWPYATSRFTIHPSVMCYQEALNHQIIRYMRVPQTLKDMKACLASGYPIVFGFSVYENFNRLGADGMMAMPEGNAEGGHCVVLVGFDDDMQRFIVRNSWGDRFGARGYFYMPYRYATDRGLASDFWTIRSIEVPG